MDKKLSQDIETRDAGTSGSLVLDQFDTNNRGIIGKLTGYAVLFGEQSVPVFNPNIGRFRETMTRKAIEGALGVKRDILATFNHDTGALLGRTSNDSLKLSIDDRGLKMEVDLPDTSTSRDTIALIKSGLVTGQSFRMRVTDHHLERRNGEVHREVRACELIEVGPVVSPAYTNTSISAECRSAIEELLEDEATADASALDNELMKTNEQEQSLLRLAMAKQALAEAEEINNNG